VCGYAPLLGEERWGGDALMQVPPRSTLT